MPDAGDDAGALFRAGRLDDAVAAANTAVRRAPGDLGARVLLAELLVFAGNLERADVILDAAGAADPGAAPVIAEFRQLLRAEMARRQVWREGRVPEFLGAPTEAQRMVLAALVALQAGDAAEARRCADEAERVRPRVPGRMGVPGRTGETQFDDFRDADDLCAAFFEVLTTTGRYFWIPTERVASIELHEPRRPRDLALRRATMSVIGGPEGDVYLPVIYAGDAAGLTDPLRLGRATDWVESAPGLVRGQGQRMFLAGEEAAGIMSLASLRFAA